MRRGLRAAGIRSYVHNPKNDHFIKFPPAVPIITHRRKASKNSWKNRQKLVNMVNEKRESGEIGSEQWIKRTPHGSTLGTDGFFLSPDRQFLSAVLQASQSHRPEPRGCSPSPRTATWQKLSSCHYNLRGRKHKLHGSSSATRRALKKKRKEST